MLSQLSFTKTKLQVTDLNGFSLVQLPACFTLSEAIDLEETCQDLLLKKPAQIVFDCGRTIFMDSSAIGALISVLKIAREQQTKVIFWSVHLQTKATLILAALNQSIIIDSETEAVPLAFSHQLKIQPLTIHPSVRSRAKRFIDILGALLGLGITAIVFIPIAAAIKFDSPGPILFGQTRYGLFGKPFRQWKFRSMVVDAEKLNLQEKNPFFKNRDIHRITHFGRCLRRRSLDNLPQFWNVLTGEMSLAGTRPPTLEEVIEYSVPMWQQLNVKPGITGEWQTNRRSHTSEFREVTHLNLKYQEQWCLQYDLNLIFKNLVINFMKDSGAV